MAKKAKRAKRKTQARLGLTLDRGRNVCRLNNADRRDWINNDEGLYRWWRGSGQSLTAFVRDNKRQIDRAVCKVLGVDLGSSSMGTNLGQPTKQDFNAIAAMLCRSGAYSVARDMALHFARRNPRFDKTRFLAAATGPACPRRC